MLLWQNIVSGTISFLEMARVFATVGTTRFDQLVDALDSRVPFSSCSGDVLARWLCRPALTGRAHASGGAGGAAGPGLPELDRTTWQERDCATEAMR